MMQIVKGAIQMVLGQSFAPNPHEKTPKNDWFRVFP
jgi:hypothetical protein